ncbi:MAG: M23 family metallopeptidase [Rhodobacteraceae bacterium]|nr:M23 family metallopeptidase [Paracoccaceae bacterium]
MWRMISLAIWLAALAVAAVLLVLWYTPAQGPRFVMPIGCELGKNCYLQQFVDHDPGPGAQDFTCGSATYDGHKGTDFRISRRDMEAGVNVLAPAPGRIRALRDGMADILAPDPASVQDRECGNGVLIDHADGWSSQLCHLKQGSVAVHQGQQVVAGQILGQVGLSGKTSFPHVHVTFRRDGAVVDPFAPDLAPATCGGDAGTPLWSDTALREEAAHPSRLIAAGYASRAPALDDIMNGDYDTVAPVSNAPLVIWGLAINGQQDDQLVIEITFPSGEVAAPPTEGLDRTKAQFFRFFGKRAPAGGWPAGDYRWSVKLVRQGAVIDQRDGFTKIGG